MVSPNKVLEDAHDLLWNTSSDRSTQPTIPGIHEGIAPMLSPRGRNALIGGGNYHETWEEWPTGVVVQTGEPHIRELRAVSLIVRELGDDDYDLVEHIPIKIEKDEDSGWVATFPEGRIGMPGSSILDARDALLGELIDSFELLSANRDRLGPIPREQLDALERYIRRR